jgi:hypothetical protein
MTGRGRSSARVLALGLLTLLVLALLATAEAMVSRGMVLGRLL